jgi:hypothetical protein
MCPESVGMHHDTAISPHHLTTSHTSQLRDPRRRNRCDVSILATRYEWSLSYEVSKIFFPDVRTVCTLTTSQHPTSRLRRSQMHPPGGRGQSTIYTWGSPPKTLPLRGLKRGSKRGFMRGLMRGSLRAGHHAATKSPQSRHNLAPILPQYHGTITFRLDQPTRRPI